MSDLERVRNELARLTERLRKVNNRKGAGAKAVRHHLIRPTTPRPKPPTQYPEQ